MSTVRNVEINAEKRAWQSMRFSYVGNISEVVHAGGGKLTPPFDDPGEPRKPKGQESYDF